MTSDFPLGKLLNFISDNLDASVITSIELEDALAVEVGTIELLCESQNC